MIGSSTGTHSSNSLVLMKNLKKDFSRFNKKGGVYWLNYKNVESINNIKALLDKPSLPVRDCLLIKSLLGRHIKNKRTRENCAELERVVNQKLQDLFWDFPPSSTWGYTVNIVADLHPSERNHDDQKLYDTLCMTVIDRTLYEKASRESIRNELFKQVSFQVRKDTSHVRIESLVERALDVAIRYEFTHRPWKEYIDWRNKNKNEKILLKAEIPGLIVFSVNENEIKIDRQVPYQHKGYFHGRKYTLKDTIIHVNASVMFKDIINDQLETKTSGLIPIKVNVYTDDLQVETTDLPGSQSHDRETLSRKSVEHPLNYIDPPASALAYKEACYAELSGFFAKHMDDDNYVDNIDKLLMTGSDELYKDDCDSNNKEETPVTDIVGNDNADFISEIKDHDSFEFFDWSSIDAKEITFELDQLTSEFKEIASASDVVLNDTDSLNDSEKAQETEKRRLDVDSLNHESSLLIEKIQAADNSIKTLLCEVKKLEAERSDAYSEYMNEFTDNKKKILSAQSKKSAFEKHLERLISDRQLLMEKLRVYCNGQIKELKLKIDDLKMVNDYQGMLQCQSNLDEAYSILADLDENSFNESYQMIYEIFSKENEYQGQIKEQDEIIRHCRMRGNTVCKPMFDSLRSTSPILKQKKQDLAAAQKSRKILIDQWNNQLKESK